MASLAQLQRLGRTSDRDLNSRPFRLGQRSVVRVGKPGLVNSLHGWSLRHNARDTLYVWKFFDCWMSFGRAQPRGQHEQVDVGGAEAIAQHPFIAVDLLVDYRPGLSQSTVASQLRAVLSTGRIGKSVGIVCELKRVLYRVRKIDERLEKERSCRSVYRGCESRFGMTVTQEDRYRGAFIHGA